MFGETITFETPGRGLHEITGPIAQAVKRADIETGVCSVFIRHTSASLIITENADPSARHDLQRWIQKLAPEGDPAYTHTSEGPDDMPSHLRAAVTHTEESIPVTDGVLDLGQWQGLFIFEHRSAPHHRLISVRVWE
ncbi:MAG: YjbQ family protein [Planctomycetes bacterium]|nr:YjbQ family protein [Planctomycetota bacterium]MBT6540728.1 YjbQ family protein [Planctomycetota bacterium]MBT6967247.1 YjbQ family protein [Planctomycetota bacterium]MBT7103123.1 YjbQ family protein [Planctomycetota bacterium]MBT7641247.1 YjbQ family protein [Planctomycetota bacterium]